MSRQNPDMTYTGKKIKWGNKSYAATSGKKGWQKPKHACESSFGPLPEGLYRIYVGTNHAVKAEVTDNCTLVTSSLLQEIPRGDEAGKCDGYLDAWGHHRIRMMPYDSKAKNNCSEKLTNPRGGFYLHDSTKGYSHGCIETETNLFERLKDDFMGKGKDYLYIEVNYDGDLKTTNGGTKEE